MNAAVRPGRERPAPGRPGLLAYALAWLAYLAAFTVVLASVPMYGALQALTGGVANVLPASILGLAVLRLQPLLPWPPEDRLRFFLLQLGAGLLFAGASTAGTWLLFALAESVRTGMPTLPAGHREVVTQQLFLGLLAFTVITVVRYAVEIQRRLGRQEARAAEAEALRTSAELEALRARLDPHFLFNTLHTLLAVVRRDPTEAEDALERFARLIRYTLRAHREGRAAVALSEEWRFIEDYLELESLRLGDRLRVDRSLEREALSAEVPALLLQPLVENAVRHAVAPSPDGARISIAARLEGDVLRIEVADDGPGASPESIESADGLGLRIIRERVARLGGEGRLAVETAPGEGFVARLTLPLEP